MTDVRNMISDMLGRKVKTSRGGAETSGDSDEEDLAEAEATKKYATPLAEYLQVALCDIILPNGRIISMAIGQQSSTSLVPDTVEELFMECCGGLYAQRITVRNVVIDGALEHRNWMRWRLQLSLRDVVADIYLRFEAMKAGRMDVYLEWSASIINAVKDVPKVLLCRSSSMFLFLSVSQPAFLSVIMPTCLSSCMFVCLCVCVSVCLSVCVSV
jgi:hypothetical protein